MVKSLLILILLVTGAGCKFQPNRYDSFKPGEHWLDNHGVHINAHGGGILFREGTYYWYGEHKIEGEAGNKAHVGVHIYSSEDLYNWVDRGVALRVVEDDSTHDIASGCILERPKVIFNQTTGKYLMWFHQDGTAYHIYSSEENSTLHISQLTPDYLSYSGKYARIFVERYMEAPALFRPADGSYFLIASDCTGWAPNAARSAVAERIWGPWTELGNPCIGKDASLTFHSQSTYVLPVQGIQDAFIFMADRWNPANAIDGRYVWLPVRVSDQGLVIEWKHEWDLSVFRQPRI